MHNNINFKKKKYNFLNIKKIIKILPHQYPFILIDKIIQLNSYKIIGLKNITINENFFIGHFPKNPIMPGILQVEALAQAGGILILNKKLNSKKYSTYLLSVEKCKFKKIVIPGDILILKCKIILPIKRNFIKMKCKSFIKDKLTCEATISAKIKK